MADEFMKGFAILTVAGMVWFTVASWLYTPSFEGEQLFGPGPESPSAAEGILMTVADVAFWFAILGALTFWVLVPAYREGRRAYAERRANAE